MSVFDNMTVRSGVFQHALSFLNPLEFNWAEDHSRAIPRLRSHFFAGEEKRAWYNLFAHARDSLGIRIRVDIFRVLARSLPLYSRICTTDVVSRASPRCTHARK